MEYISVKEAAEKWGVSKNYVQRVCLNGRVEGAVKISGVWEVPENAEKPSNMSKTEERNKKKENAKGVKEATAEKKAGKYVTRKQVVLNNSLSAEINSMKTPRLFVAKEHKRFCMCFKFLI